MKKRIDMDNVAPLEYEQYVTRVILRTAAQSAIPDERVLDCNQGDIIMVLRKDKCWSTEPYILRSFYGCTIHCMDVHGRSYEFHAIICKTHPPENLINL